MMIDREQVERLISRVLDGEASPAERARLEALRRTDSRVRALADATRELDTLVGGALRRAMDSARGTRAMPRRGDGLGRYIVGGIAALIGILAWVQPTLRPPARLAPSDAVQARMSEPRLLGDVIEPLPSSLEVPELRVRGTEREWILIPADQPGLYWVIEADRERTHVVPLSKDL